MQITNSQQLKLLIKADQIMFNLDNSANKIHDLHLVGCLLHRLHLVNDPDDLDSVISAYNHNLLSRFQHDINKH